MQIDYVYNSDGTSTYLDDKKTCFTIIGNDKRYMRIENAICEASSFRDIKCKYEIRQLDSGTKLMELKCDKIRVIYFLYEGNTFVFLGTFIKKGPLAPRLDIQRNNNRIVRYKLVKSKGEQNG